jgi:dUTP pyrophosphatase
MMGDCLSKVVRMSAGEQPVRGGVSEIGEFNLDCGCHIWPQEQIGPGIRSLPRQLSGCVTIERSDRADHRTWNTGIAGPEAVGVNVDPDSAISPKRSDDQDGRGACRDPGDALGHRDDQHQPETGYHRGSQRPPPKRHVQSLVVVHAAQPMATPGTGGRWPTGRYFSVCGGYRHVMPESEVEIAVRRLDPDLPLPSYAHRGDAGADLMTATDITIAPQARALVPTGIAVAIPPGYVGLIHPRSGLAARSGLSIVNAPGTIDAGYRGEIRVLLINQDPEVPVTLHRGDRIAQFVVQRVELGRFVEVRRLPESDRGEGGYGSTGGF